MRQPLILSALVGAIATGSMLAVSPAFASQPTSKTAPAAKAGKPVVAVIEANWCPSCQRIKPTIMGLMKSHGKDATFVLLDVSNGKAKEASAKLAKTYGLTAFFQENQSMTSTVGIFRAGSHVPAKVLVGEGEEAPYLEALKLAAKR